MNPDMTQEVKVQTSNFGADSPNGPVIVNAISKSGSAKFHGQAYMYVRNSALNANTWANNNQRSPKQAAAYYYPGGNFGGPIKVPGTSFNKNDKLLFWFGYGSYYQLLPSASPLESYVPTAAMEGGNFTSSGTGHSALCPGGFTATATNWCNNLSGSVAPDGTPITGGDDSFSLSGLWRGRIDEVVSFSQCKPTNYSRWLQLFSTGQHTTEWPRLACTRGL